MTMLKKSVTLIFCLCLLLSTLIALVACGQEQATDGEDAPVVTTAGANVTTAPQVTTSAYNPDDFKTPID